MKKISLLLSALLLSLFAFTSCDDDSSDDGDGIIIEDGIYVLIGGADGEMATNCLMGAGTNEADDNAARSGMYEKYIALEAGVDFTLVKYTAGDMVYYGADLAVDSLGGDNEPDLVAYSGALIIGEDATAMSMSESGLYHIVLDLNTAGDLSDALIIVAPAKWGMRGAMNSWGNDYFETPTFNAETMTFTMSDIEVPSSGQFKFAYGNGWKIELDEAGEVKANTNLGNDADEDGADFVALLQGGKNFAISKGIYTISLTWTLTAGAIANSYSYDVELTEELANTDWSAIKWDAVGSGVSVDNSAAEADGIWSWGNRLLAGTDGIPTVDGEEYTYTWSNVTLVANEGFKLRQLNSTEDGSDGDLGYSGIDTDNSTTKIADVDGNITVTETGNYTMTLVIDAANADAKTFTIVEVAD